MTAVTGLRHPPGVLPVKTGSAVMLAFNRPCTAVCPTTQSHKPSFVGPKDPGKTRTRKGVLSLPDCRKHAAVIA